MRQIALILAVAMMMLSSLVATPATARLWKISPEAIARDYATILDIRPGGESFILGWLVPQTNPAGGDAVITLLRKYVVVIAARNHLDRATGKLLFEDVSALQASDQTGRMLTPIAKNDMPPVLTDALAQALFRRSVPFPDAPIKLFVFDGAGIDSCSEGRLSIPLAGETYTWNTPFPGCQQN